MNYDEALAKVREKIGKECRVTKVDTAPYGWMFHYTEIDWENQQSIGRGPIFVDVFGEMFGVPGFPPREDFYDSWEAAHPECKWSETENAFFHYGKPLVRGQNKDNTQIRIINNPSCYPCL